MGERVPVSDIVAAVREGRVNAATAAEWHRLRLDEADRARHVRAASSTLSTGEDLSDEEWRRLFGSLPGHEEEPNTTLIYPGGQQGRRDRSPVSWDGYVSASGTDDYPPPRPFVAMSPPPEDEEIAALWPPRTEQEAEARAAVAAARAQRVEDEPDEADEEQHWYLFGDTAYAPGDGREEAG